MRVRNIDWGAPTVAPLAETEKEEPRPGSYRPRGRARGRARGRGRGMSASQPAPAKPSVLDGDGNSEVDTVRHSLTKGCMLHVLWTKGLHHARFFDKSLHPASFF